VFVLYDYFSSFELAFASSSPSFLDQIGRVERELQRAEREMMRHLVNDNPAVAYVYDLVKNAEYGKGVAPPDWKPRCTGLHLVAPTDGRGESIWMSPQGEVMFRQGLKETAVAVAAAADAAADAV